jgi:hypothetical protein
MTQINRPYHHSTLLTRLRKRQEPEPWPPARRDDSAFHASETTKLISADPAGPDTEDLSIQTPSETFEDSSSTPSKTSESPEPLSDAEILEAMSDAEILEALKRHLLLNASSDTPEMKAEVKDTNSTMLDNDFDRKDEDGEPNEDGEPKDEDDKMDLIDPAPSPASIAPTVSKQSEIEPLLDAATKTQPIPPPMSNPPASLSASPFNAQEDSNANSAPVSPVAGILILVVLLLLAGMSIGYFYYRIAKKRRMKQDAGGEMQAGARKGSIVAQSSVLDSHTSYTSSQTVSSEYVRKRSSPTITLESHAPTLTLESYEPYPTLGSHTLESHEAHEPQQDNESEFDLQPYKIDRRNSFYTQTSFADDDQLRRWSMFSEGEDDFENYSMNAPQERMMSQVSALEEYTDFMTRFKSRKRQKEEDAEIAR